MPAGVRLVSWEPKKPPVAIVHMGVVTDVLKSVAATLRELEAWAGRQGFSGRQVVRAGACGAARAGRSASASGKDGLGPVSPAANNPAMESGWTCGSSRVTRRFPSAPCVTGFTIRLIPCQRLMWCRYLQCSNAKSFILIIPTGIVEYLDSANCRPA